MKVLLLLLAGLALAGCAPAAVRVYADPALTREALVGGGVTVLPAGLGPRAEGANLPELRREVAGRLGAGLGRTVPGTRIVPVDQTSAVLAQGGLLDRYAATIAVFDQTGLLRAETLDEITAATGTRYAAFPYLQNVVSREVVYNSGPGFFGRGFAPHTRLETAATLSLVLWDKATRRAVFEGTGLGVVVYGAFGGGAVEAINGATDDAVARLNNVLGPAPGR